MTLCNKINCSWPSCLEVGGCNRVEEYDCGYHPITGSTTGRLTPYRGPDIQQIPIRTEEGRRIRAAFLSDQGPQDAVIVVELVTQCRALIAATDSGANRNAILDKIRALLVEIDKR